MVRPFDSGRTLVTTPVSRRSTQQLVEAAELEIAPEDQPHPLGLLLDDDQLLVLAGIAQRHHAADPQALLLGGGDLVADALGGDLALELGEGQQHVQRQPAHARSWC